MTRILADECIPMPVVSLLRKQGFDVLSILESHASEPDSFVIEKAVSEQRLILTADVELASQTLRLGTSHFGTVLLRMGPLAPREVATLVLATLQAGTDWSKLHSVLSPGKVRSRALKMLDDL